MLKSFTRNYEDNSTEAGFQFTFYCDICNDGYRSTFIASESHKKDSAIKGLSQCVWAVSNLFGGALNNIGNAVDRGASVLSERFNGMSAEWQQEHEAAFNRAMDEARGHFHRCESCHKWVCDSDFNEDEGLCVECAPRLNVAVTRAKAKAIERNLNDAAEEQVLWSGKLQTETVRCPSCGKPCGTGKFCSNCGASLAPKNCPSCGAALADGAKFCAECGKKL